jgi:AcrR family transcriptional regulator
MRGKATAKRTPKRNLTRAEKTEVTQRALYDAAAKVVGKSGYVDASIAKITQEANVAQGTFYNYFSSQQELFDQLLPLIGQRLIDRIREARAHDPDPVERERIGFETFFDFLLDVPEFYRLLTEAETFAPEAHRAHTENMVAGYVRALKRLQAEGWLKDFREQDFEPIGYMLIGMRHYLAMRYSYRPDSVHRLPRWITDAYIKLLSKGLFGERNGKTKSTRTLRAVPQANSAAPDARLLHVGDWRATAEIDLDSRTAAAIHGAMSNLAATAGLAAVGGNNGKNHKIVNASITVVGEPQRGLLVASAEAAGHSSVANVSIHQGGVTGTQLAFAQISFARGTERNGDFPFLGVV